MYPMHGDVISGPTKLISQGYANTSGLSSFRPISRSIAYLTLLLLVDLLQYFISRLGTTIT